MIGAFKQFIKNRLLPDLLEIRVLFTLLARKNK